MIKREKTGTKIEKGKRMNRWFLAVGMIILLSGCGTGAADDPDGATEDMMTVSGEDSIGGETVSGDDISETEEAAVGEVSTDQGDEEESYVTSDFRYTSCKPFWEDSEQYSEVFADLPLYSFEVPREVIVGDYDERFPEELQQLLVYRYDNIKEGDDAWEAYQADYEEIAEGTERYTELYDEIVELEELSYYGGIIVSLWAVDIDSDGEDECISRTAYGTGVIIDMDVIDYDNGWYITAGGDCRDVTGVESVLEYEGTYYLLLDSVLVCYNDSDWMQVGINREITGYTPHEVYSRDGDDMDYLSAVDLEVLSRNGTGERLNLNYWNVGGPVYDAEYVWECEYDGKMYQYAISYEHSMKWYPWCDDAVLTIFEEKEDGSIEAVKVYYLASNYYLFFDEKSGATGSWHVR
ncbi:MAG: hypothetical protein K2K20_03605 [Lachnospiraceae bacterium]|nr:hypothetical protein [Lachnospiraceae bacterium]